MRLVFSETPAWNRGLPPSTLLDPEVGSDRYRWCWSFQTWGFDVKSKGSGKDRELIRIRVSDEIPLSPLVDLHSDRMKEFSRNIFGHFDRSPCRSDNSVALVHALGIYRAVALTALMTNDAHKPM